MEIIETNLDFDGLTDRDSTNRIILHHSGVTVLQSVDIIHNYHKYTNGWAGIGYHFYVRKDGNIYRGRPEGTIGAHAYGANRDSIGICFEGNFEEETMNETQLKAGQELVAYLKNKWGIDTVIRHKDVNNTDCPGANFPFDAIKDGSVIVPEPDPEVIAMRKYQNGSTPESVFADARLTIKIGELNPKEKCDCYGIFEGRAIVRYEVDRTKEEREKDLENGIVTPNYKVGFVEWLDGVK